MAESDALGERVDPVLAATQFSGVLRVDCADGSVFERAAGLADRRWAVPMTIDMRLSVASATKGFTALTVMSLIEAGVLTLDTRVRTLLRDDLPLIDDAVTVEQLLAHRSGIGDYIDESAMGDIADYAMQLPVQHFDSAEAYLAVLDGYPQVSPPGERFAYNNGAFVVLAIVAERAAKRSFHELVDELVVRPSGLTATGFIRCDSLPPGTATGYLHPEGLHTNSLHLPLIGCGDGGMFTTAADVTTFWKAMFAGGIVSRDNVALMTRPISDSPDDRRRYGLGFWLHRTAPAAILVGYDAGVSFHSLHDPTTGTTKTVIGNTSDGAWDVVRALDELRQP